MDEDKEIKKIKEFTLNFFKSLNCNILDKETHIIIKNVPDSFENFVDNYSPYILVFDMDQHKLIEDSELMEKGSYLLKSMREYLETTGQTTLLKLNIQIKDPKLEIKKELKFNNCKIMNVTKLKENDFILRFIFLSTCQYLNEKEQFLNSIYENNNNIISFDSSMYEVIEGNREDIINNNKIGELVKKYNLVKANLKSNLNKNTQNIKSLLKGKLDKEITRLQDHYSKQVQEKDDTLENREEKFKITSSQLEHAYYDEDIRKLKIKLKKIKEEIDDLKKKGNKTRLNEEKEFQINEEINKHKLDVTHKLINASIMYYPTFLFNILLKNKQNEKHIKLNFDPIKNKMNFPICESCKKETKEINLCSNSHITCNNCLSNCSSCNKEFCNSCLKDSCSKCNAKLCKDCTIKCPSCGKNYCKDHIKTCPICKKNICIDCLTKCPDCNKLVCKDHLKKCPTCEREICEVCAEKDFIKCSKCSKTMCSKCVQKCKICEKVLCKEHSKKCSGCRIVVCEEHLQKCPTCKKMYCPKCMQKCQGCGKVVCKDDLSKCPKCGTKICEKCVRWKKRLFGAIKTQRCVKCENK